MSKKRKKDTPACRHSDFSVYKRIQPIQNTIRAIIIVDNEAILNALRDEYKRTLRQTEKAEKEYQTFQQQDLTKWREWIHAQFGSVLTEIRDCHEQYQRLDDLLEEVFALSFLHEVPEHEAYQIYKAQKEGTWNQVSQYFKIKDPYEDELPSDNGEDLPDDFDDDFSEDDVMREMAEQFANMYEKETGQKPPGYEKVMADLPPKKPNTPPDRTIKSIYRTIVLRLHPDRNKEFTPHQQMLWNEAQVAYQDQNLAALELILARIDSSNNDIGSIKRGSVLRSLIEKVERDLRMLQKHLNEAKQSPAWKFCQTKNLQSHYARARRELEHELRQARQNYLEKQQDFYDLEKDSNSWWEKITRPRPFKQKKSKKARRVDQWTGDLPF